MQIRKEEVTEAFHIYLERKRGGGGGAISSSHHPSTQFLAKTGICNFRYPICNQIRPLKSTLHSKTRLCIIQLWKQFNYFQHCMILSPVFL